MKIGRYDKEVSGTMVWILFAGLMLPAMLALIGGATMFQSHLDTEGLEMLVGGLLALAVQLGLIRAGYRRQLAWVLGIGWASVLAYNAWMAFGPPIGRAILSLIVGTCVSGWEFLASISRLEWIALFGLVVVFSGFVSVERLLQRILDELKLMDIRCP